MSNGNALCQTTHKLFYVHPSAYYNLQTTFKHIPKTIVILMKKFQKWNMNKLHYVVLHKLCSVAVNFFPMHLYKPQITIIHFMELLNM